MLLPDKHITLAESILGLGAFVLSELFRSPQTVDRLYERVAQSNGNPELPAYHDFDALLLAILFLYSIGVIELNDKGVLRLCAS